MAATNTKRYNDRVYEYDSILDTEDREDYVYGSAAPERAPQREETPRRTVRRIDTSGNARRIRATSFNWSYVLFIMMTVALLLFGCIGILSSQSDITSGRRQIVKAEEELQRLRAENNSKEIFLQKSVDLNEVYRIATEELGMVYPSADQVIYYERSDGGYVRQYEDIPNS